MHDLGRVFGTSGSHPLGPWEAGHSLFPADRATAPALPVRTGDRARFGDLFTLPGRTEGAHNDGRNRASRLLGPVPAGSVRPDGASSTNLRPIEITLIRYRSVKRRHLNHAQEPFHRIRHPTTWP